MAYDNMMLYVASYDDATTAGADYRSLKDAQAAGDFAVIGAVVLSCDGDGKVTVDEHGAVAPVAGSTVVGGAAGLVVGLFAPPLLAATALGAGIGAGIGALVKRHEEKELGVAMEEYLPPGSSAVVVIAEDMYADRIDGALAKSSKKINKAIDSGDYEKLRKELDDAETRVSEALGS